MPSERTGKNTFFGNDENASELSNKDDNATDTLKESDSSEETTEQANPFGNHIRVTKSPVPPLRIPQQPTILKSKNLATGKFGN